MEVLALYLLTFQRRKKPRPAPGTRNRQASVEMVLVDADVSTTSPGKSVSPNSPAPGISSVNMVSPVENIPTPSMDRSSSHQQFKTFSQPQCSGI